jgi:Uncharacterized protein conserved in bacteria
LSDIETRAAPEARPVILTIRGRQNFDDLEPDGTELVTGGLMTVTPEGYVLSYEESELTGMKGTVTTFEIKDGRVYLTRSGTVNSRMVFEEGKQHTSLYETPFGELSVDIRTSRLRQTLTERGGLLEVRYSIAVEHTVTGQNSFLVRVREKN